MFILCTTGMDAFKYVKVHFSSCPGSGGFSSAFTLMLVVPFLRAWFQHLQLFAAEAPAPLPVDRRIDYPSARLPAVLLPRKAESPGAYFKATLTPSLHAGPSATRFSTRHVGRRWAARAKRASGSRVTSSAHGDYLQAARWPSLGLTHSSALPSMPCSIDLIGPVLPPSE